MTKRHFIEAAEIVRNILRGYWKHSPPAWATEEFYDSSNAYWDARDEHVYNYTRAVQTAEAFITLFRSFNPRFDESRFLVACGLAEPAKKGRKA